MSRFGLSDKDLEYLNQCFAKFTEVKKVILFGSRAMGNFKPGSDIDLAVVGTSETLQVVSSLKFLLEDEGPLPYFADVLRFESIDSPELLRHIEEHGVVIYS